MSDEPRDLPYNADANRPEDPHTTTGLPLPTDNPADNVPEELQTVSPPGQATSPESDTDAKAYQRTGDPEADAQDQSDALADASETQRVSWVLPRTLVDRIKTYQADHQLGSQSDAVIEMLTSAPAVVDAARLNY